MGWRIEISAAARRDLKKLDPPVSKRILDYLEREVMGRADPRTVGKSLVGELAGYWRYRVGDYRILCHLEDAALVVLVVKVDTGARCIAEGRQGAIRPG